MKLKFVLFAVLLVGCVHPLPPAEPTPPPVDAGVPDIFTGYVADCNDQTVVDQSAKAVSLVTGCLDFDGGYDACLVKGLDNYSKDTIVCVTIDLGVKWQRLVAKDTATDIQRANAIHANDWIRRHQIGARR